MVLTGTIVAVQPLRHTPAGVPVVELVLHHQSTQKEAHQAVQIAFEVRVWGAGEVAQGLSALTVGQRLACKGFLALPSQRSRQLVLRTQAYQLIYGEDLNESE